MTALLLRGLRDDDLESLRARVNRLEAELAERGDAFARMNADLDIFKARYRREVGTLYDQLDALEHAIAEAELGELRAEVGDVPPRFTEPPEARPAAVPRFTTDAVRALFRDVAKAIHPDLTRDDVARARRHVLMIEANRAYADGDEEQLRLILSAWERSPEAVQGGDPAAVGLRLARRATQLEERLAALQLEFEALKTSPLWALKAMVDDASGTGRDLVAEMVARLKRDLMVAGHRLDAMRPPT